MEVSAIGLVFDQIHVEVGREGVRRATIAHLGVAMDDKSPSLPIPLSLQPRARAQYFSVRTVASSREVFIGRLCHAVCRGVGLG